MMLSSGFMFHNSESVGVCSFVLRAKFLWPPLSLPTVLVVVLSPKVK